MSDKSSTTVNLVILGLVGAYLALPLLPQGDETKRNVYRSRDDCLADYSDAQCEQTGYSSGGSGGGNYRGPTYHADGKYRSDDPGPGRYARENRRVNPTIVNTETSYRGGFGSMARKFGVGG